MFITLFSQLVNRKHVLKKSNDKETKLMLNNSNEHINVVTQTAFNTTPSTEVSPLQYSSKLYEYLNNLENFMNQSADLRRRKASRLFENNDELSSVKMIQFSIKFVSLMRTTTIVHLILQLIHDKILPKKKKTLKPLMTLPVLTYFSHLQWQHSQKQKSN